MKLVKKKKSTHLHSSIYVIQSGFRCIHVLNESFKLSFIRLQADIVIWNYRNILEEIRMEYCTITAMTTFRRSFQGCCCSKISFINTGGTLFVKKRYCQTHERTEFYFAFPFLWRVTTSHDDKFYLSTLTFTAPKRFLKYIQVLLEEYYSPWNGARRSDRRFITAMVGNLSIFISAIVDFVCHSVDAVLKTMRDSPFLGRRLRTQSGIQERKEPSGFFIFPLEFPVLMVRNRVFLWFK